MLLFLVIIKKERVVRQTDIRTNRQTRGGVTFESKEINRESEKHTKRKTVIT